MIWSKKIFSDFWIIQNFQIVPNLEILNYQGDSMGPAFAGPTLRDQWTMQSTRQMIRKFYWEFYRVMKDLRGSKLGVRLEIETYKSRCDNLASGNMKTVTNRGRIIMLLEKAGGGGCALNVK